VSLLAVDIGSSSSKAVAFALDGDILAERSLSYRPDTPQPSHVEMPVERFWASLCAMTRSLANDITRDPVEAMTLSSHGESFVPVDRHNEPVSPAILNMDNRALAEAEWMAGVLGRRRIFDITGLAVHPMYPVPKILWLRENQKDVFAAAARFLGVTDYLLTRLGVPAHVDFSLASRLLAFDIHQRCWSQEILSCCDLSPDRFATPVPAGTVVGQLSPRASSELGLHAGVQVVVGGHDQPCAALGLGVTEPGRVSASLGTYECLLAASEVPSVSDQAYLANLNSYCHVAPDRYVTIAYFPSGIMMDWFLHLIRSDQELSSPEAVNNICQSLEAQVPSRPTGLYIAPNLLGTCNPDFNPAATGMIVGLRPTTTPAHIYKGILEGIACELANMTELLQRAAGLFGDIYVTGGGCRSRLGLELRASIASCRLHQIGCPEAVCLGTAILAGVGSARYRSFAEAIAQLARIKSTVDPNPEITESYRTQVQQYRLLNASLAAFRAAPTTEVS
jgi:xylulokinase